MLPNVRTFTRIFKKVATVKNGVRPDPFLWLQVIGVPPQKPDWAACLFLARVLSWLLVAWSYLNLKLTFVWAWNRRAKRLRDQARIKRFKNRSIDRLARARKSFQDSPIPTWKTFKN